MRTRRGSRTSGVFLVLALAGAVGAGEARIEWPLDRTAYFIGETVPMGIGGVTAGETVKVEAVGPDGRTLLFDGEAGPLLLDTARLAPGEYAIEIGGARAGTLILASPLRRSAASLQDEAPPGDDAPIEPFVGALEESGLTAAFALGEAERPRRRILDAMARTATLLFVNCDTRPTSFFPPSVDPIELDGMAQRMLLAAQANARHPNFAGFCFGWDPTGFAVHGRKGLLVYWGWGEQAAALRSYIERQDRVKIDTFRRRTGLAPVTTEEYITYLLSIGRPEFAPAIDLPTRRWLDEMARRMGFLSTAETQALERRIDAWAAYLMGLYAESYSACLGPLQGLDPTLRHTSSVQIDHAAVRDGPYFPWAYERLAFRYQTTWNDQVGGPDYAYQWLFTAGLLAMSRGRRPVWISSAFGAVHGRSPVPGKLVRVAAHNLAHGGSGVGFALEGFSTILSSMNPDSTWSRIRAAPAGDEVRAAREFLDRFAALALGGWGDNGAGVLFSRSQHARQHLVQGFGTPQFKAFVALTRLGYTPRFVTEEEIEIRGIEDLDALLIVCQTAPLRKGAIERLEAFVRAGGRILADRSTTIRLPGAEILPIALPFSQPGKPHSWTSPNLAAGENDAILYARWHKELAPVLARALGDTGRGLLASERGADAEATLLQIDGGPDATYVVAVNDSSIATQADWHQVKERIFPTGRSDPRAVLYDATDERCLGPLAPLVCDLSMTPARVFAVLPRPIEGIALAATQRVRAGDEVVAEVAFRDGEGKRLQGVLPFHLALVRPDGRTHQSFYRATSLYGVFSMAIPLPANAPAGTWRAEVRSQLSGEVGSLPIEVVPAAAGEYAAPFEDRAIVRDGPATAEALKAGGWVLPLFDGPHLATLAPIAGEVKRILAARGVDLEIRERPGFVRSVLAYDPTPEEREAIARADRGEAIGRIERTTVNGNDWFCGTSGFRFGRPVILLDIAGEKDNEMAERLDALGILWPRASGIFPGPGRAVVQLVSWAFAARIPAIVIQATDAEGLLAGARSLANPPADRLTPGIRSVRATMLGGHGIGGGGLEPPPPAGRALSSKGLAKRDDPKPFAMIFRDERPLPAGEVRRPAPPVREAIPLPATIPPSRFIPHMRDGDRFIEATTPGGDWPKDLRFSDAILVTVEAKTSGRTRIVAEGTFRFSDRRPRSQAQWEEILALRDRIVPAERLPMEIEVVRSGAVIGRLAPALAAERDVPIDTLPGYATEKPRTVREEVVVEIAGEIDLASGRQELLLVHRNIVDGVLDRIRVGTRAAGR